MHIKRLPHSEMTRRGIVCSANDIACTQNHNCFFTLRFTTMNAWTQQKRCSLSNLNNNTPLIITHHILCAFSAGIPWWEHEDKTFMICQFDYELKYRLLWMKTIDYSWTLCCVSLIAMKRKVKQQASYKNGLRKAHTKTFCRAKSRDKSTITT